MTSTNINIGIEGRASSRILKPPGGAHSDIFGASKESCEMATSRYSKQARSAISECFAYSSSPPKSKQEPIKEIVDNMKQEINENGVKNGTCMEDENTKPTSEVPSASRRVRVPPGGFSSGLW